VQTTSVRVRFLGSGDAFSSGGRLQTCFHLDGGREPLLIDCGASALASLKREGLDPAAIGFVALSHLHGDHFGGLPWLILDGRFGERSMPLEIAGPPTTQERLKQVFTGLYPGAAEAELPFELRFRELRAGTSIELGPASVTPFLVSHESGAPSHSLRIEYGDKVITYSGDTAWTDSLRAAASGADLFICECNYFDEKVPGHLDYRTLLEHRSELDCKRLVLTHMGDDMLKRRGEVDEELASDGLAIEV
jgi:ribonuclease BN (tRNA processing enzyme)